MARRRYRLGEGDETVATVLCYFTRVFSSGVDDAKSFDSEPAALKFAKKCVKEGSGSNPHAIINYKDGRKHTLVTLTRTRRLQVKR